MRPLIRKMVASDHRSVVELWRAAGLTEEPEDAPDDVAAFLASPQSAGFVAEVQGRIVGAALCGTDGRYGYLHHLAVAADCRQTGLGRVLTRTCIAHLRTRHVVIMVREANLTALGFWAREGFRRVEGLGVHYVRTDARARTG